MRVIARKLCNYAHSSTSDPAVKLFGVLQSAFARRSRPCRAVRVIVVFPTGRVMHDGCFP